MENPAEIWAARLRAAALVNKWNFLRPEALKALMGPAEGVPAPVLEARAQKAAMLWLKTQLVADLSFNQKFKDKTGIAWVDKLLTAVRLKELSVVKIGKAKKSGGLRYDVAGLQASWYGRRILESCGFQKRRTSLTREEFATVEAACAKIKLTLPQTVAPTTTERFFAGEDP